jgi:hypothetical protein
MPRAKPNEYAALAPQRDIGTNQFDDIRRLPNLFPNIVRR